MYRFVLLALLLSAGASFAPAAVTYKLTTGENIRSPWGARGAPANPVGSTASPESNLAEGGAMYLAVNLITSSQSFCTSCGSGAFSDAPAATFGESGPQLDPREDLLVEMDPTLLAAILSAQEASMGGSSPGTESSGTAGPAAGGARVVNPLSLTSQEGEQSILSPVTLAEDVTHSPEPGSMALLGIGLLAVGLVSSRSRGNLRR